MEIEFSQPLEILQYLARYPEPQIYFRAHKLAYENENFTEEALRLIMKSNYHWMLKDLVERSQKRSLTLNAQLQRDAIERYTDSLKVLQSKVTSKQQEIQNYSNLQNRISMRFSYLDLAKLHLQSGNLTAAAASFLKVHENNTSSKNQDFAKDWMLTMLWSKQYPQFRHVTPVRPETTASEEDKLAYLQSSLMLAVKNFAEEDFRTFITSLRELKVDQLKDLNAFTTNEDLGYYYILSAIITLSRTELEESLQNDTIKNLIEDNQLVTGIIDQYRRYDLPGMIQSIKLVLNSLIYDFHSSHANKSIETKIINQIIKQYLSTFQSVSITALQQILSYTEEQVYTFMEELIKKNKMKILIDPVQKMIVQKYTQAEMNNYKIQKLYKQIKKKTTKDQINLVYSRIQAAQQSQKDEFSKILNIKL